MSYRIILISPTGIHLCRGEQNRNLTLDEAKARVHDRQSDSRTCIGRSNTDAYRYNRRHPDGWRLEFVED